MDKKVILLLLVVVVVIANYAITEIQYNLQKEDTSVYVTVPSVGINETVNYESIDKGVYYKQGVLFGHRTLHGSPFYNLDKVVVGDNIIFNGTKYTVNKIHVEPSDYMLVPEEGKIYLITCTPIGINTHRIIVEAS